MHKRGSKFRYVRSIVIVLTLFTILGIAFWRHQEPAYENRTMASWIQELYSGPTGTPSAKPDSQARRALRHFGAQATNSLLVQFEAKDSVVKKWLRDATVKHDWTILERLSTSIEPPYIPRKRALEGFLCLGAEAISVLPRLDHHLNSTRLKNPAGFAMGMIGIDSVPYLLRALASPDPNVRTAAATGLQLASPSADQTISAFLGKLDIQYDPANSWTNRSLVDLTAEGLEMDCYRVPPYRQLAPVIKNIPIERIALAAEHVLAEFDAESIRAHPTQKATRRFYDILLASDAFRRTQQPPHETDKIINSIQKVLKEIPSRSYSLHLIALDVLLTQGELGDQERFAEAEARLDYLFANTGNSWLRWRDLAEVLSAWRRDLPDNWHYHAMEAAEETFKRTKNLDSETRRICTDAYSTLHPRKVQLIEAASRATPFTNPFLIEPTRIKKEYRVLQVVGDSQAKPENVESAAQELSLRPASP